MLLTGLCGIFHHCGWGGGNIATRAEAKAAVQAYIEIFYNRQRRHSRPGNLSPAECTKTIGLRFRLLIRDCPILSGHLSAGVVAQIRLVRMEILTSRGI